MSEKVMYVKWEDVQEDYEKKDKRIAVLEDENATLKTKLSIVGDYIESNDLEINRLKKKMQGIKLDHQGAYHDMADLCSQLKEAENTEQFIHDLSFNIDTSV